MNILNFFKKNLFIICCLCLLLLFFILNFILKLSVNFIVQENAKSVNVVVSVNNPYVIELDSSHLIFENNHDKDIYLYLHELDVSGRTTCQSGDSWYPTCKDYIGKYKYRTSDVKKEVQTLKTGDHTNNWEKVSSYILNNGSNLKFTTSVIFDGSSLPISVNFRNLANKTYLADQNKFSKLVGMMEVQLTKYKNEVYDLKTDKVVKTYYYTELKVVNIYSEVVYR